MVHESPTNSVEDTGHHNREIAPIRREGLSNRHRRVALLAARVEPRRVTNLAHGLALYGTLIPTIRDTLTFPTPLKVTRVCRERKRALVFRGWTRLCMHAASLSAAEGASAAATAHARAARAEAMEKEARAATEKAEAWRKAADASAQVAAAREQAQRATARESVLTAELKSNEEDMSRVERHHQLRRTKMLVSSKT